MGHGSTVWFQQDCFLLLFSVLRADTGLALPGGRSVAAWSGELLSCCPSLWDRCCQTGVNGLTQTWRAIPAQMGLMDIALIPSSHLGWPPCHRCTPKTWAVLTGMMITATGTGEGEVGRFFSFQLLSRGEKWIVVLFRRCCSWSCPCQCHCCHWNLNCNELLG